MHDARETRTIQKLVRSIDFEGRSLLSIDDLTSDQIYGLFELANVLEPWNRSVVNLCVGNVMSTLFFQPSTRTRMSFETAMQRLGGSVVSEANPLVTSSAAKEESLSDMLRVVSQYANVIVLRHPDDIAAREALGSATSPVINGGLGHWEHPTQALLDLYTLWHVYGRIEGLRVCVASPDLVEARSGHSMAQGLARLGAKVTLASTSERRIPTEVIERMRADGATPEESLDDTQDSFNDLVRTMDLVYLPGSSAPKGADAERFKALMDNYLVRHDTLEAVRRDEGRTIYVTHTLPRRAGEMDVRIDDSPSQLYFEAIGFSVSIRMALILAVLSA